MAAENMALNLLLAIFDEDYFEILVFQSILAGWVFLDKMFKFWDDSKY